MYLKTNPAFAALLTVLAVAACGRGQPGAVSPERRKAEESAKRAVATERSLDAAILNPHSLGIPPFEVSAGDTALQALGYGLADLLTTDLARSRQLQVVDRVQLNAILREIDLAKAGRLDSVTAPRVGKLVQARRLVLGYLAWTPQADLLLNAHIADIESGDVRTGVAAHASIEDILQAEKQLALQLFQSLGITLSPAEQAAVEQMPTRNVDAFLAYSRGVRFEAEGNYAAAAQEYKLATALDPGFKAAQAHVGAAQRAAASPAPQKAGAGASQVARATDVVNDRVNGVFISPLGSQLIASPFEGSTDVAAPTTTIIITVTVPQ